MTTLQQIRAHVRNLLYDEDEWSDSRLNSWINDALRDYSVYFPRRFEANISASTGVREYTLTNYDNLMAILLVEYPTGEDPQRYLERRPVTSDNFEDEQVYDVLGDPPQELIIGEEPTTGETIAIDYTAIHTAVANDTDTLTIPDYHFEAIKLFTQWQAIKRLKITEAKDPSGTTLLTMFGINSVRAERLYRLKIDEYLEKSASGGYAGPWVMDGHDRVY